MVGIASLKPVLREAQSLGRNGDTILAHINPREAEMLRRSGGSGTRNPRTGLLQFDDGESEGNQRTGEGSNPEAAQSENQVSDAQVEAGNQANAQAAAQAEAQAQAQQENSASARQEAERNSPENVATPEQNNALTQAGIQAQAQAEQQARQEQIANDAAARQEAERNSSQNVATPEQNNALAQAGIQAQAQAEQQARQEQIANDAAARQQAERNALENVATPEQNNAMAQAQVQAQQNAVAQAAAQEQANNSFSNGSIPSMVGTNPFNFTNEFSGITPSTIGVPSIVTSLTGPAAFTAPGVNTSMNGVSNPYGNNLMGMGVPGTSTSAGTYGGTFTPTYGTPKEIDLINKQAAIESGPAYGWGAAYNMASGAFGRYGLTATNAVNLLDKYHPDLSVGMTPQQKLDSVLANQDLQQKLAIDLQRENLVGVKSLGVPVNDVSLRVEHLLGGPTAKNVLTSSDDTPVRDLIAGTPQHVAQVLSTNPSFNTMTVGEIKEQAARQMAAAGKVSETGTSSAGGYGLVAQAETPAVPGSVLTVGSGNPQTPVSTITTTEEATKEDTGTKTIGGVPGGNPDAANVPTKGEIDWSKGNLPGINNTKAKEDIYNQQNPNFPDDPDIVNTVSGDTPETYAQKFTNGDLSKVQSRITDINGFPQVEFFSKDLGDVFGEMVGGIMAGPGALMSNVINAFNPEKNDAATVAAKSPSTFSDWLSSFLNPKPTTSDNGFRSSETQPTYQTSNTGGSSDRVTGGGKDNITNTTIASTIPTTTQTTTPIPPVNTPKGIEALNLDLARRKYVNRGSVKTTSAAYPDYEYNSRFS